MKETYILHTVQIRSVDTCFVDKEQQVRLTIIYRGRNEMDIYILLRLFYNLSALCWLS